MSTSLVTGAAGFIGSHVCDHLLAMGHTVIGLDDLSGGYIENVPQEVIFQKGSILDVPCVDSLFKQHKPDYVFHLAAYAAENLSHWIRRHNYMVNVVGSANIINASIEYGVKRFVFTSSAAVYGYGKANHSEFDAPEPIDPYGIAKASVERDLLMAADVFGMPFTVFRMHNVYGERQNIWDSHRNVIGIFIRQCLAGQKMTIYGDGHQTRQFTYIDDVAPHIVRCVEMPDVSRIFNIGHSYSRSVETIATCVASEFDRDMDDAIEYLPFRHEANDVRLTHREFEATFGKQNTTEIYVGIHNMAEWARHQQKREPRVFTGIEVSKNFPEAWKLKTE